MTAIDTNLLVYAAVGELDLHRQASTWLSGVCDEHVALSVPWPVVHEFLSGTTRPKVLRDPLTMGEAIRFIGDFIEREHVRLIGETDDHFTTLSSLSLAAGITGPRIHDARIAAICIGHGIDTIWTADRDFDLFEGLSAVNPLD